MSNGKASQDISPHINSSCGSTAWSRAFSSSDKLQGQEGYATQLGTRLAGGPSAFAAMKKDLDEEMLAGSLCFAVGDDVVAKKMAKVSDCL